MSEVAAYIGQRLSLKSQTCTVRYVGQVADKQGQWLGVEWDDASRGKHDGTHEGVSYFKCRSKSPTAASFLRPKQNWDESRTLLQALREKYISPEEASNTEIVYISGKYAEEVGLEKLAKRQAQLLGIHTLVLDRMCIRYHQGDDEADRSVADLCANITTLDLGGNLFETWDEILHLCRLFPKLHSLTLDGNRLRNTVSTQSDGLPNIRYLGLANTLLEPAEIASATSSVPKLQTLILTSNELEAWEPRLDTTLPSTVHSIDLSKNDFTTLASLTGILTLPNLHTLILKSNKIGSRPQSLHQHRPNPTPLSQSLKTLDLRANEISTWAPISSPPHLLPSPDKPPHRHQPPLLKPRLRRQHLPHTLRRLHPNPRPPPAPANPKPQHSQIARECAKAPTAEKRAEVLSAHPRWEALCAEYGEPVVTGPRMRGEVDPASLAARLVRVTFYLATSAAAGYPLSATTNSLRPAGYTWTSDIPRSASVYSLLGRVGKKLDVVPLGLRLVWETGEKDPVGAGGVGGAGAGGGDAPEEWDSSDDGEDGDEVVGNGGEWVAREVELGAGTRAVGSYFEGGGGRGAG
ncbi:hypothetical protein Q7P36_002878 [Cladosporium allicinum]